jgi:hypothetical protein
MAETANLVVQVPGEVAPQPGEPAAKRLTIDLAVAFAERRSVQVEVSEAGIGEVADTLHRIGGEALVREFSHALGDRVQDATFDEAVRASEALRILERHTTVLRTESITYLEALDAAARQLFEHDLTLAAVELQPQKFGFHVDQDGNTSVASEGPDLDRYRQLRSVVAELDALRRNVKQWNFTIPPNAPTARRQFEEYALEPYTQGLKASAELYPALVTNAPKLLKKLEGETASDIAQWEADPSNKTRLDEVIQEQLLEAFKDLRENQPKYRQDILSGADRAMAAARSAAERYWDDSPAEVLGRLHPLWKHRFLVQSALEQQSYRPGDHGYAVGIDSLYAAMAAQERSREEAAEMDRILGWASIGFGILTLIPVIGEFALVATIAITAIQTLEEAQKYSAEATAREALGHQASRYDVPEPDAIGLICNVLSLTADVALPVVGKLLSKTVLRPTTRVIAATRVKTVLTVGQHSANLTGLVVSANASLVERELRRLQLLTAETGRK